MKYKSILKGIFISLLAIVLLLSAAPSVFAETTDSWVTKAPMTTSRKWFQTQVVNGKIYALGGLDDWSNGLSTVEEYDPALNTWTEKAPMSTQRIDFQTEVVNGKIYAIGGWVETLSGKNELNELPTVEEYNPVTNTWTTKASMPAPRSGFQTAVIDGKIYAFGGVSNSNSVEEYDPTFDTWTTKASMPYPRCIYDQQIKLLNGKIYSIGETVEEYDSVSDTWATKAPMHYVSRCGFQTEVISGKIYVIGGWDGSSKFISTVEEYDPESNTWTIRASMSTPRMRFQTAVIDGKIYAIGGWREDGDLSTVEEYDPATDTWKTLKSMSSPRSWHKTEVIGKKIYVIGGEGTVSVSIEEYTVLATFNPIGAAVATVILVTLGLLLLNKILRLFGVDILPAIQTKIKKVFNAT